MYFHRLDIHLFIGSEISSIAQQQQFQRCLIEYFCAVWTCVSKLILKIINLT